VLLSLIAIIALHSWL